MSFLSRLFGKAPSPPPAPAAVAPATTAPAASPADRTADRTRAAVLAAQEEETLQEAIRARDAGALAQLVVSGLSTKVRQRAAQAVEDPERVRQLIRDVRGGNDKSVYRILTAKRDALLAASRRVEALQAEVNAAAAALERHSRRSWDALYAPTLEQFELRWKEVAPNAAGPVAEQAIQAVERAREVIALHLREIAARAAQQLAAENSAALAQRLREEQDKAAAAAAAEHSQRRDEEQRAAAEAREAESQALRQLGGLVRKAQAALHEGSTGRAAGLRRALQEKLATAPPLPGYLAGQIEQLDKRLDEMKDWKNFSVGSKRVELVQEMQSLVGSTLEPPVLAEQIKALQQQWRTLSRGAGENLEEEWQRFHEAAQQAYQPCREYFEAQALQRADNLQRRQALVQRLSAFEANHDWQQPDWPLVLQALRESRQQWRQHSPVERAAGKAVQAEFDAMTGRLQERLNGEYNRNSLQKQQLIARAEQLLSTPDSRQAIEEVKSLQGHWRSVGPVPRDEDHRLWDEFRQHCDAVFQRRQQEFAQYTASQEANREQAVRLCEQLEQAAQLSGDPLVQAAQELPALRAQFEALGELPRSSAREINVRFERAVERCEKVLLRQEQRAVEQGWSDLLTAAAYVQAWQSAARNSVASEEIAEHRRVAEDYMATVSRWPPRGLETLQRQLAGPAHSARPEEDLAENEKALRLLCIRAEIASDRATPAEDGDLRRQYQVQQLMQKMGQGIAREAGELDALALQWVTAGPAEPAVYEQLLTRFRKCRPA